MSDLLDDQHIWEMAGSYEFYRDFHTLEQAKQFAGLLDSNRIPYKIEKTQILLDAAIVGHGLVPPYLIKIRSVDFKKVNELLEKEALGNPAYIDSHYLQQLEDSELIEIVRHPNEWTVEDAAVARRILNDRGIPIPKEHVHDFIQKNNEELRKGKKGDIRWLLVYMLAVFIGGIFVNPLILVAGIGMGWYYWKDKTVDNQGFKFYSFEPRTRLYGKVIFYLGWFFLIIGGILTYRDNLKGSLSFQLRTQHFPCMSVSQSAAVYEGCC